MNLNEQLLTAWTYESAVRTKASQLLCQTLKIERIDAFTEIQLIKKAVIISPIAVLCFKVSYLKSPFKPCSTLSQARVIVGLIVQVEAQRLR